MKVSDVIAGQKLVTARIDADVGTVAELMRTHHVHGVPIVAVVRTELEQLRAQV